MAAITARPGTRLERVTRKPAASTEASSSGCPFITYSRFTCASQLASMRS